MRINNILLLLLYMWGMHKVLLLLQCLLLLQRWLINLVLVVMWVIVVVMNVLCDLWWIVELIHSLITFLRRYVTVTRGRLSLLCCALTTKRIITMIEIGDLNIVFHLLSQLIHVVVNVVVIISWSCIIAIIWKWFLTLALLRIFSHSILFVRKFFLLITWKLALGNSKAWVLISNSIWLLLWPAIKRRLSCNYLRTFLT